MEPDGPIVPGTGVDAASQELLIKLLGPTCEYLGGELKTFAERRVENLNKIVAIAKRRLGKKLDEPGQVPPRVAYTVWNEGSVCEDELCAEYFGGVLASARTQVGRDDRALTYARLVAGLSTYQIRAHYIFYTLFKQTFTGKDLHPSAGEDIAKMHMFVPLEVFNQAMDFAAEEEDASILEHILTGLKKNDLIAARYAVGTPEQLAGGLSGIFFNPAPDCDGIAVLPAPFGVELYHWVHGRADLLVAGFLEPAVTFDVMSGVVIAPGARPVVG
jgi:hypothetical protein